MSFELHRYSVSSSVGPRCSECLLLGCEVSPVWIGVAVGLKGGKAPVEGGMGYSYQRRKFVAVKIGTPHHCA